MGTAHPTPATAAEMPASGRSASRHVASAPLVPTPTTIAHGIGTTTTVELCSPSASAPAARADEHPQISAGFVTTSLLAQSKGGLTSEHGLQALRFYDRLT